MNRLQYNQIIIYQQERRNVRSGTLELRRKLAHLQRAAIAAMSLIACVSTSLHVHSQPVSKEQLENSKRATDRAVKEASQKRAREPVSGILESNHPPLSKEQIARANLGRSNSKDADQNIKLDAIVKHLSYCMAPKAQFGQYSSFDGGKSAAKLALECPKEILEYTDNCISAGRSNDDCMWELAILAQVTIKMFGK